MTTTTTPTDRAAINRRNAQKSTGARTPEGKNRSRFNAVKHGMTAQALVLPDEDAHVLQIRLESFFDNLQPQNEVEQVLVEQAVLASWRLERAGRAEIARLSHILESVPIDEANRQREEAAALGRRLFRHRDVSGDLQLQSEILGALLPGRKSPSARPLDVLDHPEAIVHRLETTAAGCQWLRDRWTELRAPLDQGASWPTAQKVQAIRLLGRQPLDMGPEEYERHRQRRIEDPHPKIDARFDRLFDRQLDDRLSETESASIAVLGGVADRAMARLEMLAAGHRERAEAHTSRQAAMLSFDASTEGERLRRYQFSCSRSLFRSLDTLIKVRRSGLGAASEERTEGSESGRFTTEPYSTSCVPCSGNPPVDHGDRQNEPTAPPVDHTKVQNEPTAPPIDHTSVRNEPTTPQVAAISGPGLPFLRALISAMTLVLLFGAAVGSHRDSQDEPRAVIVDQRKRQNEATAATRRAAGVDVGAVSELSGTSPRPNFRGGAFSSRSPRWGESARRAGEGPSPGRDKNREITPGRFRRVNPNRCRLEQCLLLPRKPTAQVRSDTPERILAGFPILSKSDRPQCEDETAFPSPDPTMRILIVDDEPNIRMTLRVALESMRHSVEAAAGIADAVKSIERSRFDLALVDLRLGNESGLELLETCLRRAPRMAVVIITAHGTIDNAVEAMRRGAFDYLAKPFLPAQVRAVVERVERLRSLQNRVDDLEEQIAVEIPEVSLESDDPQVRLVLEQGRQVAATDAVVLIRGESGTGKGVLARAIHGWSRRARAPFVTVSCPSLSAELLESELFGHARGSFTGAVADTEGKVAAAEAGTLFLDEIGDLPLALQPKLLRFLQERQFERVGETRSRTVDVRLVTATNRDIDAAVAAGQFREDLLFRLNVVELALPPLRVRSDRTILAEHLLAFFARQTGKRIEGFTPAAREALLRYGWPGNLRELRNAMERAVIFAKGQVLDLEDLPGRIISAAPRPVTESGVPIEVGQPISIERLETEHIRLILARCPSREDAAHLGIDPSTLYRKRKQLGL